MIEPLLIKLHNKKEKFRTEVCKIPAVQDFLIVKLKESGSSKLGARYNSSIKGLNQKIQLKLDEALLAIESGEDPSLILSKVNLSYKTIFSDEIKQFLNEELLEELEAIVRMRNEIVTKSKELIESVVAKKKSSYNKTYGFDDLVQESYIIAYESTILYDHSLATHKEITWFAYLKNRLNKILSKILMESHHLVSIPRNKVTSENVREVSLSDYNLEIEAKLDPALENILDNISLQNFLTEMLTEKEYDYIARRFGLNGFNSHSTKDLTVVYNCSFSMLISLEKQILKKLKGNLEELDL